MTLSNERDYSKFKFKLAGGELLLETQVDENLFPQPEESYFRRLPCAHICLASDFLVLLRLRYFCTHTSTFVDVSIIENYDEVLKKIDFTRVQ